MLTPCCFKARTTPEDLRPFLFLAFFKRSFKIKLYLFLYIFFKAALIVAFIFGFSGLHIIGLPFAFSFFLYSISFRPLLQEKNILQNQQYSDNIICELPTQGI